MDPFALIGLLPLAVAAVFVLAIVVAVRTWRRAKQRREAVARWAMLNNLTYTATDGSLRRFDFHLFGRGDGRGWDNVASGTWRGHEAYVADYWYYEESSSGKGGRSRSYRRFSVAVLSMAADVPAVRIARETAFSRLADRVGFRDIEFESEEFNRRFDVRADDREFAFKLLDARMIEWLLALPGRHCYEVKGSWLLAYTAPTEPGEVVAAAKEFLDRIPRLVWADYGTAGS